MDQNILVAPQVVSEVDRLGSEFVGVCKTYHAAVTKAAALLGLSPDDVMAIIEALRTGAFAGDIPEAVEEVYMTMSALRPASDFSNHLSKLVGTSDQGAGEILARYRISTNLEGHTDGLWTWITQQIKEGNIVVDTGLDANGLVAEWSGLVELLSGATTLQAAWRVGLYRDRVVMIMPQLQGLDVVAGKFETRERPILEMFASLVSAQLRGDLFTWMDGTQIPPADAAQRLVQGVLDQRELSRWTTIVDS